MIVTWSNNASAQVSKQKIQPVLEVRISNFRMQYEGQSFWTSFLKPTLEI